MKCFVFMAGFEDESLASESPPPPVIETPSPAPGPPPAASATPPPIEARNSTRNSVTGGAANLSHLAAQFLLLLPLLAFL